jgi:hypothetical protein
MPDYPPVFGEREERRIREIIKKETKKGNVIAITALLLSVTDLILKFILK